MPKQMILDKYKATLNSDSLRKALLSWREEHMKHYLRDGLFFDTWRADAFHDVGHN